MRDIAKQNSTGALSAVWRLALCALGVAWLATAAGCSWVGLSSGPDPSPAGDPVRLSDALAGVKTEMGAAPEQPYWPYRAGELYASADSTAQAIATRLPERVPCFRIPSSRLIQAMSASISLFFLFSA